MKSLLEFVGCLTLALSLIVDSLPRIRLKIVLMIHKITPTVRFGAFKFAYRENCLLRVVCISKYFDVELPGLILVAMCYIDMPTFQCSQKLEPWILIILQLCVSLMLHNCPITL